jgi:ABC-type Mn2+/Zn2+ transport system ATPase subunit
MKLTVENIGALKHASIELADLTVIAGENDSGKSTVGKIIFALIQAFSRYPILLRQERNENIRRELERLFIDLRRNFDIDQYTEIREILSPVRLLKRIEVYGEETLLDISVVLHRLEAISPEQKLAVIRRSRERLEKLKEYVRMEIHEPHAISNSIFKALQSEFNGEIVSKTQSELARIAISDGATTILKLALSDEGIVEFWGGESIGFEDATFVDGPSILQYHSVMRGFNPLGESQFFTGSMPFHVLDLSKKLTVGKLGLFGLERISNLNLGNTYKGKVFFDSDENNFFLDKGGYRVSANNIASGVKSMGLLDLLIDGGYVRDGTLLILDEPETNLHPKWQIEYAKMLCTLIERGAKILVTSHSPYMVEALKGFSDKKEYISSFYLASKTNDGEIRYIDSSRNISPIIHVLSEPLANLLNEISDDF